MVVLTGADLRARVRTVPFARGTPLAIAVCNGNGALAELAQGHWPDGKAVSTGDLFYGASLAKQVTGAAIAVLVKRGLLRTADPIGRYIADLPDSMRAVTIAHLLGHTAGLPAAGVLESTAETGDWTTERALEALRQCTLTRPPGTGFAYSNLGYICLALIVRQATGMSLSAFAQTALFDPLGLTGLRIQPEDEPPHFPQVPMMGTSLPRSLGDGGLWTSAPAFARWLDCQNRDALAIAEYVEAPGRLLRGTTDYGWGIGLRRYRGMPLFIHGGSWQGACAKAVRSRAADVSIVAFAASTLEQGNIDDLVDTILAVCI